MTDDLGVSLETKSAARSDTRPAEPGSGAISTLRVFAWLELASSILAAIWIWAEFGQYLPPGNSYVERANPLAIGIGFGVLLQGIFLCAFFLVVASIADSLIVIKRNTARR